MSHLARLEKLKSLLDNGTLTRDEFEALKQKEMQTVDADRGSDRASDGGSERSVSPAIGEPILVTASDAVTPGAPAGSSALTLAEMSEVFRKELGVAGTNLVELVQASCARLGVSAEGKSLAEQANECWRVLQAPTGASPPASRASGSALVDSIIVAVDHAVDTIDTIEGTASKGGMNTTDLVAAADLQHRISERISRARMATQSTRDEQSTRQVVKSDGAAKASPPPLRPTIAAPATVSNENEPHSICPVRGDACNDAVSACRACLRCRWPYSLGPSPEQDDWILELASVIALIALIVVLAVLIPLILTS